MLANLNSSLSALDGPAKPGPKPGPVPAGRPGANQYVAAAEICASCYLPIDSGMSLALNGKQYHQRCYHWCVRLPRTRGRRDGRAY